MALRFRPLTRADFPLLAKWLSEPHVHLWWREPADPEAVEANYGPAVDGTDPTELFVVEYDDQPIGTIVIAVQQDNRRSWRALEKAGFQRAWSGPVETGDPSDEGPSHVYVLHRPS